MSHRQIRYSKSDKALKNQKICCVSGSGSVSLSRYHTQRNPLMRNPLISQDWPIDLRHQGFFIDISDRSAPCTAFAGLER
jgi:hypothetical protein